MNVTGAKGENLPLLVTGKTKYPATFKSKAKSNMD